MAAVMSSATGNAPALAGLFAGKSFFLVQRLPQRASYINEVQSHGGRVVRLEAQADYIIADHLRRDCPPGSLSYSFIDAARERGELPDPEDHPAGPSKDATRAAGSAYPTKTTRTPYTDEDDRILLDWVDKAQSRGLAVKGNAVYKELEAVNNRHTWQSWRDHYLKVLEPVRHRLKPTSDQARTAQSRVSQPPGQTATPEQHTHKASADVLETHTEEEVKKLVDMGADIIDIDPALVKDAWNAWAQQDQSHTAEEWAILWKFIARPRWERLQKEAEAKEKGSGVGPARRSHAGAPDAGHETGAVSSGGVGRDKEQLIGEASAPRSAKRKRGEADLREEVDKRPRVKDEPTTEKPVVGNDAQKSGGEAQETRPPLQHVTPDEHPLELAQRRLFGFSSRSADEDALNDMPQQRSALEPISATRSVSPEKLATSEANRAADRQLRRNMEPVVSDGSRPALTTANLASQQAVHKQTRRAADIPEDDEGDDQGDFIQFLQDAVGRSTKAPLQQEAVRGTEERHAVDRHVMSDRDIDDVFAANTQWPFVTDTSSVQGTAHEGSQRARAADTPKKNKAMLVGSGEDDLPSDGEESSVDDDYDLPGYADDQEETSDEDVVDLELAPPDGGWSPTLLPDAQPKEQREYSRLNGETGSRGSPPKKYGEPSAKNVHGHEVVDVSSGTSTSSEEEEYATTQAQTRYTPTRQALDTQAVLDMETQQLDFDLPWPLQAPSSPANAEDFHRRKQEKERATSSSSTSEHNAPEIDDNNIDAYILHLEKELGYAEVDIVYALKATSARSQLAEYALKEHAAGRGWPTHKRGIWSQEEDEVILASHPPDKLELVAEKMGWDEISARIDFLRDYDQSAINESWLPS